MVFPLTNILAGPEPPRDGQATSPTAGVCMAQVQPEVQPKVQPGLEGVAAFEPGLPPAEPFPIPVHSDDVRVDVESALAMLAPARGFRPLLDISAEQCREDLARAGVMALSFVAQSARGIGLPMVPQREIDKAKTIVQRFMIRWRGEPDPQHVRAVDAYFTSAVLEQKKYGRLVRPSANYTGPSARRPDEVPGWNPAWAC
jgi:citrate synthase